MKKQMILSAVFGVILFGFGFAHFAMAGNNPIPGVDIIVRKSPGGIAIQVKTGADGSSPVESTILRARDCPVN